MRLRWGKRFAFWLLAPVAVGVGFAGPHSLSSSSGPALTAQSQGQEQTGVFDAFPSGASEPPWRFYVFSWREKRSGRAGWKNVEIDVITENLATVAREMFNAGDLRIQLRTNQGFKYDVSVSPKSGIEEAASDSQAIPPGFAVRGKLYVEIPKTATSYALVDYPPDEKVLTKKGDIAGGRAFRESIFRRMAKNAVRRTLPLPQGPLTYLREVRIRGYSRDTLCLIFSRRNTSGEDIFLEEARPLAERVDVLVIRRSVDALSIGGSPNLGKYTPRPCRTKPRVEIPPGFRASGGFWRRIPRSTDLRGALVIVGTKTGERWLAWPI
jgi:hypothetical protein